MRLNIAKMLMPIVALLWLGACSSSQPTSSSNSPAPSPSAPPQTTATAQPPSPAAKSATNAETGTENSHGGQGGQVVETGKYHLELVTLKEGDGTHLDFYLQQGENHAAVPGAKVVAQVQFPNGTQKTLNLKYDAPGKHYYAVLPGTTAGEYRVAILSDINGEKVNARYRFQLE